MSGLCPTCLKEFKRIRQRRFREASHSRSDSDVESNVHCSDTGNRVSVVKSEINNETRNVSKFRSNQPLIVPTSNQYQQIDASICDADSSLISGNGGRSSLHQVSTELDHRQLSSSLPQQVLSKTPILNRRLLNDREQFLLFVKILFKLLALEPILDQMLRRAKMVVGDCTRRNRNNEPEYLNLSEAIETHLKPLIVERIWTKAKEMLHSFMIKQQRQRDCTTTSDTSTPLIEVMLTDKVC